MKSSVWKAGLNIERLQYEISLYRWRPGVLMRVFDDPHEGPTLILNWTTTDFRHPETTTDLGIRSRIPTCLIHTTDDFQVWLLWRLLEIDAHECREALVYRDKIVRDPHDPLEPATPQAPQWTYELPE